MTSKAAPPSPRKAEETDTNRRLNTVGFQRPEHMRFLPAANPPSPPILDGGIGSRHSARANFDINLYATKKSAAQGLLDLALLMANASQLKHIILTDGDHRFYMAMIVLLSTSIALQIIVAIGLLFLVRIRIYDFQTLQQRIQDRLEHEREEAAQQLEGGAANNIHGGDQTDTGATAATVEQQHQRVEEDRLQAKLRRADFLNNLIVAGILIVTVINVFISAFGLNESPRRGGGDVYRDQHKTTTEKQ